jgi:hypothetical protein
MTARAIPHSVRTSAEARVSGVEAHEALVALRELVPRAVHLPRLALAAVKAGVPVVQALLVDVLAAAVAAPKRSQKSNSFLIAFFGRGGAAASPFSLYEPIPANRWRPRQSNLTAG